LKEETIFLKLTPLSPIHIGSHTQQLRGGIEFIQDGGKCYVIDEKKLAYQLAKGNRLENFVREARGERFNLREFFRIDRLEGERRGELLTAISSYSSPYPGGGQSLNQIRPFVRDAYAHPYIPGSALKGAFRTALLYCFLKERKNNQPNFWEKQMNRVRANLGTYERLETKRKTLGEFLQEFLQNFDLYYEDEKIKPQPERQQTDLLRAVGIPDLPPLDKDSLVIREVRVVSLTAENSWKFSRRREEPKKKETQYPLRIYSEVLAAGRQDLQVKVDLWLWEKFRARGNQPNVKKLIEKRMGVERPDESENARARRLVMGLLSCCQEFARDIFIKDRGFFDALSPGEANIKAIKNFYNRKEMEIPSFRIGWGSGMLAAGILSLIEDKEIIREVARLFLQYRRHGLPYGGLRDDDPIFDLFPKTRRVIMENDAPALPLGWAKLEIL
jgi:CRISPR type III-A-associated RAMP protein Csm5